MIPAAFDVGVRGFVGRLWLRWKRKAALREQGGLGRKRRSIQERKSMDERLIALGRREINGKNEPEIRN